MTGRNMLHIILGILKVIGMILGIILLILLFIMLAVFFVPVRYRIRVRKGPQTGPESQNAEEIFCVFARASWLLHIVSVSVSVNVKRETELAIRLFGFRLPFFSQNSKAPRDPEESKAPREPEHTPEDAREEKAADSGKVRKEEPPDSGNDIREDGSDNAEEGIWEDEIHTFGYGEEQSDADAFGDSRREQEGRSEKKEFLLRRICDRIASVFRKVPALLTALWEKPQKLLELAEKLEARAVLGDVLEYLNYLLRHYKPRRIEGRLKLGTADPALSARLTGLVYLLLPARADRFTIDTEFSETVFEIDMICSGHIRACHAARILWRGFRNKKLRRLIRYLRKKELSGKTGQE